MKKKGLFKRVAVSIAAAVMAVGMMPAGIISEIVKADIVVTESPKTVGGQDASSYPTIGDFYVIQGDKANNVIDLNSETPVTLFVKATTVDNKTIKKIDAVFAQGPSASVEMNVTGDAIAGDNGCYSITVTIPTTYRAGTYYLRYLCVTDSDNKTTLIKGNASVPATFSPDIYVCGYNNSFSMIVSNTEVDNEYPSISDINVSVGNGSYGKAISVDDVRSEIKIKVSASDNVAIKNGIEVDFVGNTHNKRFRAYLEKEDDSYVGTVTLNQYIESDIYSVDYMRLCDTTDNCSEYSSFYTEVKEEYEHGAYYKNIPLTDNMKSVKITINNAEQDSKAPVVKSYFLKDNKTDYYYGDTVELYVEVSDDKSGIQYGSAFFSYASQSGKDDNSEIMLWTDHTSPQTTVINGKTYTVLRLRFGGGKTQLDNSWKVGQYKLSDIQFTDNADNKVFYNQDKLVALNGLLTINVKGYAPASDNGTSSEDSSSDYSDSDTSSNTTDVTSTRNPVTSSTGTAAVENKVTTSASGEATATIKLPANDKVANLDVNTLDAQAKAVLDQAFSFDVKAGNGVIPSGASMKISKVVTGTEYSNAKAVTNAVSDKIAVFEIDLLNSNDVKVQPNGKVSITTDIPNGFDPSRVVVYRLSADGKSYTKLTSTVSGGKISFETDHFSTYIVAQESVTKVTDKAPVTADKAPLALLAFVLLSAGATLVAGTVRKCAK